MNTEKMKVQNFILISSQTDINVAEGIEDGIDRFAHQLKNRFIHKLRQIGIKPEHIAESSVKVFYSKNHLLLCHLESRPSVVAPVMRITRKSEHQANGTLEIERDVLNQIPLWEAHDHQWSMVSNRLNLFSIIPTFTYQFIDDHSATAFGLKPVNFSPCHNISLKLNCQLRFDWQTPPGKNQFRWIEMAGLKIESLPALEHMSAKAAQEVLFKALTESAQQIEDSGLHWGVTLSGGIDSGTTAALLKLRYKDKTKLAFSLATELGSELDSAKEVADYLNYQLIPVDLKTTAIMDHVHDIICQQEIFDPMTVEILTQMKAIAQFASHYCQGLATGYGSDLLMGGMLTHELYLKAVGAKNTRDLVERTFWSGELRPAYLQILNLQSYHLFWQQPVIEALTSIPLHHQFSETQDKVILRQVAAAHWLPAALTQRKKLGLTEGTHVHKLFAELINLENSFDYQGKAIFCWKAFKNYLLGNGYESKI